MIELSPGAVIGQYKLIKPLREPLHSHSWLAIAGDGEQVVLKLFGVDNASPQQQDFDYLLQLNHPALDTTWIRIEHDGWIGFARHFYQDLGHPGDVRFEFDRMLALGMRLSEALQVSHDAGLAHGRLQRSNLFTRDNNQLIVTDPAAITGSATAATSREAALIADMQACGTILENWAKLLNESHPRGSDENNSLLLPPRLAWLLGALKAPGESLAGEGFARVRDELDDIRLQWQRALREGIPANWSEGRADYRPETSSSAEPISASKRQIRWQPAAAVAVLAMLLIVAIWILPAYFSTDETGPLSQNSVTTEEAEIESAEQEPEPPTAEELAALLARREQAQQVLDEVINLRLQLESQEVTRWAEKAFTAAVVLRDAGDEPYRSQDFTAALQIYSQARDALQQIFNQSRQVVEEHIKLGQEALDRGDSATAANTFGLALAIDPENTDASLGLQRSESLDEVLALLDVAQSLEESGALEEARESYLQINKVDPHTPNVAAEIERLAKAIAQRNFRSAMSSGLAALNAGDLQQANAAFSRAQRMQPSASGPAEGLQEVSRQERDLLVLQQREQALALEGSENWPEAVNLYQSLMEKDPNLKFAQDSAIRARDRANLDSELVRYLSQPSSWWSENGRKQAVSLLSEARSVDSPGPRLQQQKQQLETEIRLAGQQVPIQLHSDNLCNVVVYKIGRLGQFQSTELTLYPGYYTAVGVRDGFRDTRREFLVQPGKQQAVTITCSEEI